MRFFTTLMTYLVVAGVIGATIGITIFYYYGVGLPDYKQLSDYQPPVVTRMYAGDGRLFGEYAWEKRIYVPLESIPKHVRDAFLSAEDKNFYDHMGIDIPSIIGAVVTNLANVGGSKRPIGASTITQQVAKNFLLAEISHLVSLERKIKEAILAFRIEHAYEKDYILELYLNEVYLGGGAHGVAAAALVYFNKSLDEVTVAEAAFLAALPKAPSRYHPVRAPKKTKGRRDWVLGRMLDDGKITEEQAREGKAQEITLRKRDPKQFVKASYFAEEVRRDMVKKYGEKSLYEDGYVVRTTMNPRLQKIAADVLRKGLERYDRKHGWRGPVTHLNIEGDRTGFGDEAVSWVAALKSVAPPAGLHGKKIAVVLSITPQKAEIGFKDGHTAQIPLSELKWARKFISTAARGPVISHPKQVLGKGDVVIVDYAENKDGEKIEGSYKLCQIPKVSGALVALDPHTGRVLAMQGGYSFELSQFNRVTQAKRQTGSAFKPFVFFTALEQGLTPSSMIDDSPFAIDLGWGLGVWRPNNWDKKFRGPITLRKALEISRNVAVIRMVHYQVGMKNVVDVAKRFEIDEHMPVQLSGVLGASETTVMKLAAAYATFVNGGKKVEPTLIDRIQNRRGETVLVNNSFVCDGCNSDTSLSHIPYLRDMRVQIANPIHAYQMVSMLHGAIVRGTGRSLMGLGRTLAGKSGTTNDFMDAWFVGFSRDLVVCVFVGFDTPKTLGDKEYGGKVAGPIFGDFMELALKDTPDMPFRVPSGVRLVRTNSDTGARARPGDTNVIVEVFDPSPRTTQIGEDGDQDVGDDVQGAFISPNGANAYSPIQGTGGVY